MKSSRCVKNVETAVYSHDHAAMYGHVGEGPTTGITYLRSLGVQAVRHPSKGADFHVIELMGSQIARSVQKQVIGEDYLSQGKANDQLYLTDVFVEELEKMRKKHSYFRKLIRSMPKKVRKLIEFNVEYIGN